MAPVTTQACNWANPECGKLGTVTFAGSLGKVRLSARFCPDHAEHLQRELSTLGVPGQILVNYKPRQMHRATSGTLFSSADARPWLMEQGLVKHGAGRISRDLLARYAEAH